MARKTRSKTKKTTSRSTRKPTARRGTKAARSQAAKKAWRTRRRNAGKKRSSSTKRKSTKSRSTSAKRSAAARKAAKTRKANAAKRSRAAKKAAATRKRNGGKRRTKRSSKRRSSKRRTKRSTKMKLGKMFTKKKFTASIMMGVGIVVTGALGLGLMGVVNNYGSQLLSSTGVLGYYSSALGNLGSYANTADFVLRLGLAGTVLAYGMNTLFGSKGILAGAGKSAFGSNTSAVLGSTAAALALYGMTEVSKLQPIGAGLIQNLAAGDVSAVTGRFKLMGANMGGHQDKFYGGHKPTLNHNNMGMSNMLQQNNSPMLLNQGAPNSGSNLFGTRKASRGRLNLF